VVLLGPQDASDEASYVTYANNLSHGFYSGRGTEVDLWFGPGLPLLLTPLAAVDAPIELMRALGALILTSAVLVFYVALRQTVSRRAALFGAAALATYWPVLPMLPTLHSEIPALLASSAFLLVMTLDLKQPRRLTLLGAGACLALLAVTRVIFGWVLLVVVLVSVVSFFALRSREVGRLALTAALALVFASPWLLYTYDVTGKPFYWASSGGMSLYWMSSPQEGDRGDWHSSAEVFSEPGLEPHRALFRRLEGLNQVQLDSELRTQAIRNIRHHPGQYVENLAANISRLWFSTPFSYTPQKLSTTFYILPNAFLLAALALAVLVFARLRVRPSGTTSFAIVLTAGFCVQAMLSAYTRMLIPLLPLVLWFIVQAAVRSCDGAVGANR
jgi:hypothetical protein